MMTNKKKMYTNKLAEVHVNSIPNEAIRTISGQFNFFLRKDFERTRTRINQNQPTKTKKSKQKTTKKMVFARTKTSKKVEIVCFGFWCFLYTQNLFVKISK